MHSAFKLLRICWRFLDSAKCLVDLLTAIEAENQAPKEDEVLAAPSTLLAELQAVVLSSQLDPGETLRRQDLTALVFSPMDVSSIDIAHLPLRNRTRNCLEREGLLSAEALQGKSLGDLLAIPAFGIKCLVDLLTAVEAANLAHGSIAEPVEHVALTPDSMPATLSPRLTREARLLGNELWAMQASLYDVRLGAKLLNDEESHKELYHGPAAGRIPLDQRRSEPPRLDLDLLRCPFLTHTRNRLREAGRTTLSSMVSLTLREIRALPGFGASTCGPADGVGCMPLPRNSVRSLWT